MYTNEFKLFMAICQNNTEKVLKILETKDYFINLHYKNIGETLLTLAIFKKNIAVIKSLIVHGADLNEANYLGDTPLCVAAAVGNEKILRLLILSGADLINGIDNYSRNFFEKLSFKLQQKISIDIINMLLDKGDFSTLDEFLKICSSTVKLNYSFDTVKDLIIKANKLNNTGLLVFLCSHNKNIKANQPLILTIPEESLNLLSKNNIDFLTNSEETLHSELVLAQLKKDALLKNTVKLHTCVQHNDYTTVKRLISNGNLYLNNVSSTTGRTPLTIAIIYRNFKLTELLLKSGANPNQSDLISGSPLVIALSNSDVELLKLLFKYNININKSLSQFTNTLTSASKTCPPEILKLLLQYDKTSINSMDPHGNIPLTIAARHNNFENLDLLLNAGANPHMRDSMGHTFISYIPKKLRPLYNFYFLRENNDNFSIEDLSLEDDFSTFYQPAKNSLPPRIKTLPISASDCKSKSLFEILKLIIDSYNTPSAKFIYDYLKTDNFKYDDLFGNTYYAILNSLDEAEFTYTVPAINGAVNNSNLFYIGDIHGNITELVKSLYVAKLIDLAGNWIGNGKTLVQLGDLIHRGEYSWETVFFMKALQLQAEYGNNKGKIIRLLGNHEEAVTRGVIMHQSDGILNVTHGESILREIFIDDILNGKLQLSYANDKRHLISFHAGMEKRKLLETILQITDLPEVLNTVSSVASGRTKLSDLYHVLDKNNIKLSDISNYFNRDYIKFVSENSNNLNNNVPYYLCNEHSIIFTRKKHLLYSNTVDDNTIPNIEKPIQVVGHSIVNINTLGKIHNWIYSDVYITQGYNSFLAFTENGIRALEILKIDNAWRIQDFVKLSYYLSLRKLRELKRSITSQNFALSEQKKLVMSSNDRAIIKNYQKSCELLKSDIVDVYIVLEYLKYHSVPLNQDEYKRISKFLDEIGDFFNDSPPDNCFDNIAFIEKQNNKRLSVANTLFKLTTKDTQNSIEHRM